jgi:hypothetical protein
VLLNSAFFFTVSSKSGDCLAVTSFPPFFFVPKQSRLSNKQTMPERQMETEFNSVEDALKDFGKSWWESLYEKVGEGGTSGHE